MMDYKNSKLYQILNNANGGIYVGSTTQPLYKRLFEHKSRAKCCHNSKIYKSMREMGIYNFYIELIELYPCNSKEELNSREGYYIREKGTLNMLVAGRTAKQYDEEHKKRIKEYN